MENTKENLLYLFLCLLTFEICSANEHSAVLIAKAGQDIILQPLVNNEYVNSNAPKFEEPARFDDLAITRLQIMANDVVDRLWKKINNAQRFAILKEQGAANEILRSFGMLKDDISKLEEQIRNTKVRRFSFKSNCLLEYFLLIAIYKFAFHLHSYCRLK